jgi:chromosome segregation ATPase
MKLLLIAILAIGLCALGYFGVKKRTVESEVVSITNEQLVAVRGELDTAQNDLAHIKQELEATNRRAAELEESKTKELAALKTQMEESAKQSSESGSEQNKKQMAEIEELKTKLTAAETQLSQVKTEAATAKALAAASQAEAQRLQQMQARPPLGTAMDKRK